MKVENVEHAQGLVKNLGNFESLKIYNGIVVSLENKETVKNTHESLRKAMKALNEQDVKRLVGE